MEPMKRWFLIRWPSGAGPTNGLGPVNTKMAGWREEALGRGPRRERGNVAAALLDRVSNAGTTPQWPLALRVAVI
jgi:hypothetical protein